jgi:DNA-binding CsgD family transcriptional regulator/PAS domain-containing protein
MATDGKLLDLIGNIYDCAIAPKNWPRTLQQLTEYLGGQAAAISLQDPLKREVRLLSQWGIKPDFERKMMEGMAINPLISMGWFVNVDEPFTGEGALGRESYLKSRFYNEIIAPEGYYDAALSVIAKSINRFGSLSVPSESPIGDTTLERLRELTPHVRRAVNIADMLDVRALENDMLSAAFDLLTIGIILVDDKSRIVHANAVGLRLLDERSAIRRDGDFLSCRDPKTAAELSQAIQNASGGTTAEFPKSGIALPIGAAGGADLAAWILPLDGGLRNQLAMSFAASAAVFFRQLGDVSPFPGELFVKRYGISPAECRVLMMLTQGMTVREAAAALGISEPTAKTHLQKLFQRTGTDRQADLMRLAMSALAPASGAAVMKD